MALVSPPPAQEYAPYAAVYVGLVPPCDIVEMLERQLAVTTGMLRGVSEERGDFRYAPGKWSIKESLGHLIDAERIFSYRALRIARGDATPLPGFEQDDYVRTAASGERSVASLLEEFEHLRKSNVLLLRHLPADAWTRLGTASGHPVSARALAWIMAGHEIHHQKLFREKYGLPTAV